MVDFEVGQKSAVALGDRQLLPRVDDCKERLVGLHNVRMFGATVDESFDDSGCC